MSLELTTTRRRLPLGETTFVVPVPPYVQTYIGGMPAQQRLRRTHLRLQRGLNETTFVTPVPPYVQTYIGQHEYDERGHALAQHHYGPRGTVDRELLGFGALDASVPTAEVQGLLRRAGFCDVGAADGLFGPRTEAALVAYIQAEPRRAASYSREDFAAERRAGTIRMDSGLFAKLRNSAAGQTDACPMVPAPGPTTRPAPMPDEGGGVVEASVFSSPLLWLGVAAVAGVAWYAYSRADDDRMLMMPPRL